MKQHLPTSLFLTCKQHDAMISQCPGWMSEFFPRYRKQWNIGGVWVYGTEGQIENLKINLSQALEAEYPPKPLDLDAVPYGC